MYEAADANIEELVGHSLCRGRVRVLAVDRRDVVEWRQPA
jgi:hypothetical protein